MAGGEFWFGTASIYMRRTSADRAARYNSQPRYYMATDLDRVRQFFPDFRRFIVMASRKLGLATLFTARAPVPAFGWYYNLTMALHAARAPALAAIAFWLIIALPDQSAE